MIFKFIWIIGACIRNPSIFKLFKELKRNESLTANELNNLQLSKLKTILKFSYTNSRFYRDNFERHNFNPFVDFKVIDDLYKIPIITKDDLINHNKDIHVSNNYIFKRDFICESSGTSGKQLKFTRDEYSDSFNRASIMRGYSWHDIKIWTRNGYLWGYNFEFFEKIKIRILDFFQNRYRVFSYTESEIKKFTNKLKNVNYLTGYSSMIFEISKIINKNSINIDGHKIKMIKGTSEKIFDNYRNEVYKAFGVKLIGEYGAAETGIIGFECKYGKMHINSEGVVLEEINNEIIVTNLINKSFPVIRYKLGDYIKLNNLEHKCECGLNHPIIDDILGRVGKQVKGYKNIYPSLVFYNVFKNLSKKYKLKLNYQIIQVEIGKLNVNIEQELSLKGKSLIIFELNKYFKKDVEFLIFDQVQLHSKKGKLVDFISKID